MTEVNPEAAAIARVRDQERAEGRLRGRLHGVPILIKDVFMTTDQINTTGEHTLQYLHTLPMDENDGN